MSVNSVNPDGSLTKIAGSGSTDTSVLKGDFSVVESTSTATRAYSIGDCFIMETGQLVRATSAIAINDTIAIGTNVAATSVAELLDNKVDKEQGKGLSTNDYDNTEKSKVSSITDKASKVQGSTLGNLAGLDLNGDLTDANWSADKTTQSATGNPILISGLKSNQLTINPIITLEPIQAGSGTPSPSNVRAISGYDKVDILSCGKNLFPEDKLANVIYNNGVKESLANAIGTNGYIVVKANTAYYFSISASSRDSNCRVFWYDKNYNVISYDTPYTGSKVYTSPATAHFATIFWEQTDSPAQYANDFLFCEDSITDKTYISFNPLTQISESLGQTVYGGSLDLRSGKLTVTKQIIDLGSLGWASFTTGGWYTDIADAKSGGQEPICSCYAYSGSQSVDKSIYGLSNKRLYIMDSSYANATDFANGVTGQKLVYELAEPFTIQLIPHEISLLKDYTYVSTNGTNIAFDYHNGEMASLADVSQLGETVNELGSKYVSVKTLYSTAFTSSATSITLSDAIENYDFIGIETADQSNSSSQRGFVFIPIIALTGSRYFADFVNSYIRINASGNAFNFLGSVNSSGTAITRYIFTIYGFRA